MTLDELRDLSGEQLTGGFIPFFDYIDTDGPAEDGYDLEIPEDEGV